MLTPKQKQLYDFIVKYHQTNGFAPSFEEMKLATNLKSKSGIHTLIDTLEEKKYISRKKGKARGIEPNKMPKKTKNAVTISWHKYPDDLPITENIYEDFAILYENPHFIKKNLFGNNHRKPFIPAIATWNGTDFFNPDYSGQPFYWLKLPSQPEVK